MLQILIANAHADLALAREMGWKANIAEAIARLAGLELIARVAK